MMINAWYVRFWQNKKTGEKTITLCGDADHFVHSSVHDADLEESEDAWLVKAGSTWYQLDKNCVDRHFRPRLAHMKSLLADRRRAADLERELRSTIQPPEPKDSAIRIVQALVHLYVYGYYY